MQFGILNIDKIIIWCCNENFSDNRLPFTNTIIPYIFDATVAMRIKLTLDNQQFIWELFGLMYVCAILVLCSSSNFLKKKYLRRMQQ